MGKLTSKAVEALAKAAEPGKTGDGDGLYLQISRAGVPSWLFRYMLAGKSREMGLGPYPAVTLAKARELAADQRKLLAAGNDPMSARDAEREAKREADRVRKASQVTFAQLAWDYLDSHGAGWSDQWRKGWRFKMETYAFPVIGKLPASAIETEHILRILQPIWSTKTRTADEVRGQIEHVLDAGKAHKLRTGDNPARWRGHLENLLSKADKAKARKREHLPALNWRDIPGLMVKLTQSRDRNALALRLLILTGARSHMVRFAEWSEFDLKAGTWSLSAERMKMRKAFDIPLAPGVVEILEALPRIDGSPYLFPGKGRTGVMFKNAFREMLHGMGLVDITTHGFRSSFRDWANECTHYPREVCELALAHDERSQTEAAYSRSDFLEKRRALMADWAAYCTATPASNVVQLRGAQG